jgi:hypothetical protein
MKPGDRVTVTAAGIAPTPAEVLDVRAAGELPSQEDLTALAAEEGVPPPPSIDISQVRSILREMGVRRVAFLTYNLMGQGVLFAALDFGVAGWRDLKGTMITIGPPEEAWTSGPTNQSPAAAQ